MSDNTNYPLIIVFYIDREMMSNAQAIQPFANSVNDILASKNANAIAFFVPTDGEDRVECINPLQVEKADMVKINKMVEDIKTQFSIGTDIDLPNNEIITGDESENNKN
jgi:hypothetical protein